MIALVRGQTSFLRLRKTNGELVRLGRGAQGSKPKSGVAVGDRLDVCAVAVSLPSVRRSRAPAASAATSADFPKFVTPPLLVSALEI